jgi:CHAD domain-containing protein
MVCKGSMADGKWINDLGPSVPLTEAAKRVLCVRLEVVRAGLPLAVTESERDPEHVHQLRVGSRRADAALRLFRSCLPRKVYRAIRGHLRRLRRAAGAARDWDVFVLDLTARRQKQPEREQPGFDFLIGYALGQRAAAQVQLEAVAAEEGPALAAALLDIDYHVHESNELGASATLLDLARLLLGERLTALDKAASGDLNDYSHLHQVRIAGKRLRYAMEVFADCFGPVFREAIYPRVEELQEILGRANDSHVASVRLTALRDQLRRGYKSVWPRLQPGFGTLLRFHQRRLPQERRRFLDWWRHWCETSNGELRTMLEQGTT